MNNYYNLQYNRACGHFEVCCLRPKPRAEEEQAKVEVRKPDLDIEDGGNVDMNDLMGQIC